MQVRVKSIEVLETYVRFNDVGVPATFRQRDLSLSVVRLSDKV